MFIVAPQSAHGPGPCVRFVVFKTEKVVKE